MTEEARHALVDIGGAAVEIVRGGTPSADPVVAAAHPAEAFGPGAADLLAGVSRAEVVCVNPRMPDASAPAGHSWLAGMVDDIEAVRRRLGINRWVFWGMSGGGWLAQIYAHRYPGSLAGIVVESACLCFRERLSDPDCVLSPFHPAWDRALRERGLLAPDALADPEAGNDAEWIELSGTGHVFRRRGGPALLVSPTLQSARMQRAMPAFFAFDSRAWAGRLRVPALVLCGTADPIVPLRLARAVHEAIPGSTFVAIEGASHVPTSQRHPAAAAAYLAFIDGVTKPRSPGGRT